MKIEDIRALAQLMRESGLTGLEYKDGEGEVRLERTAAVPAAPAVSAPAVQTVEVPQAVPAPQPQVQSAEAPAQDTRDLVEITAPLVGVYYASAEPGARPFVEQGDRVEKGDVLCIIEAMKLMNEITAERSGVVEQVCCGNGQMVEFGQTLFRIREV